MASTQYYIRNPQETYFLTMTVVDWVDAFTRDAYKTIVVDSLRFCQENKGLVLYGWCLSEASHREQPPAPVGGGSTRR